LVEHQELSGFVTSNNNLAIFVPCTYKHHNAFTTASSAIFSMVTTAWSWNSNAYI